MQASGCWGAPAHASAGPVAAASVPFCWTVSAAGAPASMVSSLEGTVISSVGSSAAWEEPGSCGWEAACSGTAVLASAGSMVAEAPFMRRCAASAMPAGSIWMAGELNGECRWAGGRMAAQSAGAWPAPGGAAPAASVSSSSVALSGCAVAWLAGSPAHRCRGQHMVLHPTALLKQVTSHHICSGRHSPAPYVGKSETLEDYRKRPHSERSNRLMTLESSKTSCKTHTLINCALQLCKSVL